MKKIQIIFAILLACLVVSPVSAAPKKYKKKKPTAKNVTYNPARVHDIHNVAVWGGAGYSGLLNNYAASTFGTNFQGTFSNSFIGGGGGFLGVGYEYKYKKFLLSVGPEFKIFSSLDRFNLDGKYVQPLSEYSQLKSYSFSTISENQLLGQLTVPILFGATFDKFYFKAGAKIGYTMLGNYTQASTLTTTITDPNAYEPDWSDIPSHGALTGTPYAMRGKNPFGLDIAMTAEVGLNIDKMLSEDWQEENEKRQRPIRMRVALFADYGVYNMSVANASQPFATTTEQSITTTSLHQSEWASSALNSLMVGVKFTAMLQMNKEKILKKPNPLLYVYTVDQNTDKLLAGAVVEYKATNATKLRKKTTDSRGKASLRLAEGEYSFKASKGGYIPSEEVIFNHVEDKEELTIALQPVPVYTIYVRDAKTQTWMASALSFVDVNTNKTVSQATTDATTGKYTLTLPLNATYRVQITADNYFATDKLITDLAAIDTIDLQPIEKKKAIVLHNLYFASFQTTILPESEAALQQLYEMLSENPDLRIRIIGHTDDVGSDRDNQILSEGRANSVRQAMIDRGIDSTRIETEGKGEKEPVVPNTSDENRAKNRRVEFMIL